MPWCTCSQSAPITSEYTTRKGDCDTLELSLLCFLFPAGWAGFLPARDKTAQRPRRPAKLSW